MKSAFLKGKIFSKKWILKMIIILITLIAILKFNAYSLKTIIKQF